VYHRAVRGSYLSAVLVVALGIAACAPPTNTDAGSDAADAPTNTEPTDATDAITSRPITATTTNGPVTGRDFGTYSSFLGIPYAAAPAGARRWRPPVAPDAWSTPRDATSVSLPCPQTASSGNPASTEEDCLRVNVWTSRPVAGTNLPVLVFIHGGGFTAGHGGNPLHDGTRLAQRGQVVVTMNYRLGQFGFLAHPAFEAEDTEHHSAGNYGFMDQAFALRWVHDNIAAFGGDPANVTIFGESAGAISVCGHLVSPLSSGLFRRAITESGSCALIFMPLHDEAGNPNASAESLGHRVATTLGCDTASDVAACLRAKSTEDVLAANPVSLDIHFSGAHYMPNVDGYVFPRSPWAALIDPSMTLNATEVITGANADEGTGFTIRSPITTDAQFRDLVTTVFPSHVDDAIALYAPSSYPSINDAANAFIGDSIFVCAARRMARAISERNGSHAFLYFFTRVNNFGRTLHLGAFHGTELPYVLGNFVSPFTESMADTALSTEVMSYWTRFAANGDPSDAGGVAWSAYAWPGDTYVELGDTIRAGAGLHANKCDIVEPWIAAR
jgi:para-nitrobenzyl esterase